MNCLLPAMIVWLAVGPVLAAPWQEALREDFDAGRLDPLWRRDALPVGGEAFRP
jgi:hypothetical protein